jgi:hypothetical protein
MPQAGQGGNHPLLVEKLQDIFYGGIGYGVVSWEDAKDGIFEIYNLGVVEGQERGVKE